MADGPRDLLGDAPVPAVRGHGGARPGAGRPVNSLSRVNQDLRGLVVALTGREAIVEVYRLASQPLFADDEQVARAALARIMRRFRCSRVKAAELWLKANDQVAPHLYPRLGVLEVQRRGAPGNPIEAQDLFGAILDVTPEHVADPGFSASGTGAGSPVGTMRGFEENQSVTGSEPSDVGQ